MKFENKGKWMSQIAESAELDSPENEEMALDMSEDEDIETQDEIEKDDEKDIEEISEEAENTDDLIEDDLDLVEDEETIDESIQTNEAMPPMSQRKRIEFEDDIVKVYDGNKEIYAGAEDYEPMQDEDWKWDNANKYYKFDKYVKVCCESSQKNEAKHSKYFNRNIYTTLEKVSKSILNVADSDYRKAQQTLGYAAGCLAALQNYVNHVGQNTDEWLAEHPAEADKYYKQAMDAANKL